jgi:hypothetical protein
MNANTLMSATVNVFRLDDLTLTVDALPAAPVPTYAFAFNGSTIVTFFGRPSQGVAMAAKLRAAADQIEQLAARTTEAAK